MLNRRILLEQHGHPVIVLMFSTVTGGSREGSKVGFCGRTPTQVDIDLVPLNVRMAANRTAFGRAGSLKNR